MVDMGIALLAIVVIWGLWGAWVTERGARRV